MLCAIFTTAETCDASQLDSEILAMKAYNKLCMTIPCPPPFGEDAVKCREKSIVCIAKSMNASSHAKQMLDAQIQFNTDTDHIVLMKTMVPLHAELNKLAKELSSDAKVVMSIKRLRDHYTIDSHGTTMCTPEFKHFKTPLADAIRSHEAS